MDSFWNPLLELEALRRDFGDLFDRDWPRHGSLLSTFLPGRSARTYPLLNIATDDDRVIVEALAPGLDLDQLEVTVNRGTLTIAGTKADVADVAPEAFHRRERAAGRFVRTLHLDREVDEDRVDARYADGILTVTLPRAASDRPRKVAVTVS